MWNRVREIVRIREIGSDFAKSYDFAKSLTQNRNRENHDFAKSLTQKPISRNRWNDYETNNIVVFSQKYSQYDTYFVVKTKNRLLSTSIAIRFNFTFTSSIPLSVDTSILVFQRHFPTHTQRNIFYVCWFFAEFSLNSQRRQCKRSWLKRIKRVARRWIPFRDVLWLCGVS